MSPANRLHLSVVPLVCVMNGQCTCRRLLQPSARMPEEDDGDDREGTVDQSWRTDPQRTGADCVCPPEACVHQQEKLRRRRHARELLGAPTAPPDAGSLWPPEDERY